MKDDGEVNETSYLASQAHKVILDDDELRIEASDISEQVFDGLALRLLFEKLVQVRHELLPLLVESWIDGQGWRSGVRLCFVRDIDLFARGRPTLNVLLIPFAPIASGALTSRDRTALVDDRPVECDSWKRQ